MNIVASDIWLNMYVGMEDRGSSRKFLLKSDEATN
jgi:hypothetical protein